VFEQPAPNVDSTEKISLADRDSERRLVDALRDAPAWVAPADGSMEPAIPVFAAAHILPIDRSPVAVGDVVLVQSAPGRCALHRVTGLGDADVRVTADAALDGERVVPHSAVIGVCDLVDVGGSRIPIRERPRGSLGMLRAIMRSRIKRRVPVATSNERLFYALDLDAPLSISVSSPPVEFRESSFARRVDAGAPDMTIHGSLASGQVVGLLKGQTVYRVSYVRGAGADLRALPDGFQPRDRVVLLHDGYTEAEFRNRGIHAAALRWVIDRERSAGVEQAVCVVRADNAIARRAVEKLGFRRVGPVD
jgi:ribosomal protein S18 acetylase RimI-like enzyme